MTSEKGKKSQKDYLKKYLSGGSEGKKKKKKSKGVDAVVRAKVKVIDDDIDLSKLEQLDESALDLYELNEDAPQIVGIVDERPDEVKAQDQFRQSQRWKVLGNSDGDGVSVAVSGSSDPSNRSPHTLDEVEVLDVRPVSKASNQKALKGRRRESDLSPPRKGRSEDSDASPPRKRNYDSDTSPPRKRNYDSDASPPRKSRQRDADASPPRKKKYDSDASPARKKRQSDSDESPPRDKRKSSENHKSSGKGHKKSYLSPYRTQGRDSDVSPPRRGRQSHQSSKPSRWNDTDCQSPIRKRKGRDESPMKVKSHKQKQYDSDTSPPRRRDNNRNSEEPNKRFREEGGKHIEKSKTTLDGKRAGLQNAKDLKRELMEHKKREDRAFQEMDASLSGRGAAVVQRDRKTGLKRDFESEMAEQRAKEEIENKHKEKYSQWGKGLKQTEDQQDRLARDMYEMSKPLARYADDADLDSYLKEQDREGDPMLEYLRNKKKEEAKSKLPLYQGSFPPNRYNIRPGYRWDGVDRSNGYEKKRFDAINAKKAVEEEAYKWSTSDM